MQPQKPKYLKLTPEEFARVQRRKAQVEAQKLDPEWRSLSEFGFYYGWAAIEAVRNNEIDLTEFNNLLLGARKAWSQHVIDMATATFAGTAATQSKKPQTVIDANLKVFKQDVKP